MATSNETTPITSASDRGVAPEFRWTGALQPVEEFERFIDRFFRRSGLHLWDWRHPWSGEFLDFLERRMPRLDVVDSDDKVVVRAEVPGVAKDNLDIAIADNLLTLKGTLGEDAPPPSADQFYQCETTRGAFTRSVSIPARVDVERATANLRDGILEIVLPKLEGGKRTTIPVQ